MNEIAWLLLLVLLIETVVLGLGCWLHAQIRREYESVIKAVVRHHLEYQQAEALKWRMWRRLSRELSQPQMNADGHR